MKTPVSVRAELIRHSHAIVQAQSRISAGIGLGGNSYAEDRDFSVNKRIIALPDFIKDINYSAVEIPVLAYQNADRTLHLRFGPNGVSATHNEKPVSWLSANRKEVSKLDQLGTFFVSGDCIVLTGVPYGYIVESKDTFKADTAEKKCESCRFVHSDGRK